MFRESLRPININNIKKDWYYYFLIDILHMFLVGNYNHATSQISKLT